MFRKRDHWIKSTNALITAANKGNAMCHVHPCRKRGCPEECGCKSKRRRALDIDTAMVWQVARRICSLILYFSPDYMLLKDVNDGRFEQRLDLLRRQVASYRDVSFMHPSSNVHRYLNRCIRLIQVVEKLYNNGNERVWHYKDKSLVDMLKVHARSFREVKHLR
jgi:hypothetical protein